jgi:hypothetical protein
MFQEPVADPLPEPTFREDIIAHYDKKTFGVTYELKTREEAGGEMISKITQKRVDWDNQWHLKGSTKSISFKLLYYYRYKYDLSYFAHRF